MTLSKAQSDFIKKYISDEGLGRIRSKVARSGYEKFARRYNKAEEALSVLPAGHPALAMLQQQLSAAKLDAENGNFKRAYKALNNTKKAAKRLANGYLTTITAGSLNTDVAPLEADMLMSKTDIDDAIHRCDHFQGVMDRYPAASDKASLTEALKFLKGFANQEAVIRADFQGRVDLLAQRVAASQARDIPGQIVPIRRLISLAEKDGRMGEISEIVSRVIKVERQVENQDGIYVKSSTATKKIKAYTAHFEKRIAAIKALDSFQSDESWKDIRTAEIAAMFNPDGKTFDLTFKIEEGEGEGEDMVDTATLTHATEPDKEGGSQSVFVRLQEEEEARVKRAMAEMAAAKARDKALTDGLHTDPTYDPAVPDDLDTFDIDLVLGAAQDYLPPVVDQAVVSAREAACRTEVENYLRQVDTDDEAYLDLMLMSDAELFAGIAGELGIPVPPDECKEEHRVLVEAMVKAVAETVLEHSPNKMADDMSTIDMNGVSYTLDKVLGSGANGEARRYVSLDGTQKIVVKSLKIIADADDEELEKNRASMADEMRTHARLLKGDTTESKSAIAEFKGAAVSSDGNLHMAMADAGGASMSETTQAMLMMEKIGAIPPEARQAMAQNLIRQTIDGLKLMEEKNLIHNDLKPENILMGSDGKVRIIDFGESRFGDDDGLERSASDEKYGVSPLYKAPEQNNMAPVDKGVDTYAIGAIMMALGGAYGENPEVSGFYTKFKAEDDPLSAIDRVASAAMAPDPADRPSLDAIESSAYLTTDGNRDFLPEDIKDLTEAAAEFQSHLSKVTCDIVEGEYEGAGAETRDMVDIQSSISYAERQLKASQDEADEAKAAGREPTTRTQRELRQAEGQLRVLQAKRDESMKAVREKGASDYQALLDSPESKVDFGDGETTVEKALEERDRELAKAAMERGKFYRRERIFNQQLAEVIEKVRTAGEDDLAAAQKEQSTLEGEFLAYTEKTNETLKTHIDRANTIKAAVDTAISDMLSPEAAFHVAEKKLKEVGSRFGAAMSRTPRAETPEDALEDAPEEKEEEFDM